MKKKDLVTNETKKLESDLDSLLNETTDLSGAIAEIQNSNELPEPEPIMPAMDYVEENNKSVVKAKRLLIQAIKFYLDVEQINNDTYLKSKLRIEQAGLSQIIQQIKLNERAIEMMMRSMDLGNIHPRMFEVFTQLQKTQIELVKMQTMFIIQMEENIKRLRQDYDFYKPYNKQLNSNTKLTIKPDEKKTTYKGMRDLFKEMEGDNTTEFENPDNSDIQDE